MQALPSPLSEMLWGGDAIGGLTPLSLVVEGAANLLFLSAPDLALVTGCVRVETAVPAEHQHVSGPLIQAFFEIIVSLCW